MISWSIGMNGRGNWCCVRDRCFMVSWSIGINGRGFRDSDGGQMMHSWCNWYGMLCVRNSMGCWNSICGCSYFLCVMLGWNCRSSCRRKELCFCMLIYSGLSTGTGVCGCVRIGCLFAWNNSCWFLCHRDWTTWSWMKSCWVVMISWNIINCCFCCVGSDKRMGWMWCMKHCLRWNITFSRVDGVIGTCNGNSIRCMDGSMRRWWNWS